MSFPKAFLKPRLLTVVVFVLVIGISFLLNALFSDLSYLQITPFHIVFSLMACSTCCLFKISACRCCAFWYEEKIIKPNSRIESGKIIIPPESKYFLVFSSSGKPSFITWLYHKVPTVAYGRTIFKAKIKLWTWGDWNSSLRSLKPIGFNVSATGENTSLPTPLLSSNLFHRAKSKDTLIRVSFVFVDQMLLGWNSIVREMQEWHRLETYVNATSWTCSLES